MEYLPDGEDGAPWNVGDWPALKLAFDLQPTELPQWHQDLAGQGRYWTIIRRIFGVIPFFGDAVEEEDQEEWDWKKLSKTLTVDEKTLRQDLAEIVEHWKKLRVSRKIQSPGKDGVKPVDAAPRISPQEAMSDEQITELLTLYRFNHVKGKDRVFVASRILERRSLFEDPNRREAARGLVTMELNLQDNETTRTLLKARLESLGKKVDKGEDLTPKESEELQSLQTSLDKNEIAHSNLFNKYYTAANNLGAEEIEAGELRKVAYGTVSQFIAAQIEYYGTGSRDLIDGMFTSDEILWQTTPIPLRPPQYRFDKVLQIYDATRPENLWSGKYEPPSFATGSDFKTHREACRRIAQIVKGLVDEAEPAHIPAIDDVTATEDADNLDPADDYDSPPDPQPDPTTQPTPPTFIQPATTQAEDYIVMG
jgi:hypothetical protein